MRDPDRIDRMIDILRQMWHKHPDQRLGQLVTNIIVAGNDDLGLAERAVRVFNVEDDVIERKLTAAIEGGFRAAERTK